MQFIDMHVKQLAKPFVLAFIKEKPTTLMWYPDIYYY